ncbi:DUF4234 domain-containing protein [Dethiothermospora halolimnae]|uniref:DUF4234 domain-containing protein n=1 Tax=Dethiothermospora halolimnae TaxID=3114390 RepID=UPI003CCBCC1F
MDNVRREQRSVASVIIFTVITCGIYGLYWIYVTSRDLKDYLGDPEINPGLDLFLCIICFPYTIYWAYKIGKLIVRAQRTSGIMEEDNSILYLLLSIFGLQIVAFAIMQSNLNKIWARNEI